MPFGLAEEGHGGRPAGRRGSRGRGQVHRSLMDEQSSRDGVDDGTRPRSGRIFWSLNGDNRDEGGRKGMSWEGQYNARGKFDTGKRRGFAPITKLLIPQGPGFLFESTFQDRNRLHSSLPPPLDFPNHPR